MLRFEWSDPQRVPFKKLHIGQCFVIPSEWDGEQYPIVYLNVMDLGGDKVAVKLWQYGRDNVGVQVSIDDDCECIPVVATLSVERPC